MKADLGFSQQTMYSSMSRQGKCCESGDMNHIMLCSAVEKVTRLGFVDWQEPPGYIKGALPY